MSAFNNLTSSNASLSIDHRCKIHYGQYFEILTEEEDILAKCFPKEIESQMSIKETIDIIIKLLPNLDRIYIENNLIENVNTGYEAKLLQECITKTLEDGFEVSDKVFEKLDEWLNSTIELAHESKFRPKSHKAKRKKYKLKDLPLENFQTEQSATSVDIIDSLQTPSLQTFTEISPSSDKESDYNPCSLSDEQNGNSNLSELTLSTNSSTNFSCNGPLLDDDPNLKLERIDNAGTEPTVIELDASDSPVSNESDILVVREVVSKPAITIVADSEPTHSGDSFPIEKPPNHNLPTYDVTEEEPTVLAENIDSDRIPWEEAHSICKLLPFFELNNIHQSIIDNYYHPKRKAKVLTDYLELALDEGHEITTYVFEILSLWQSNAKRPSPINEHTETKRLKTISEDLQISQSQPSTSTATTSDTQVQSLPPVKPLPDVPLEIKELFESLPEETKSWYLRKVDFLHEITNFAKEYILSKILHCQTETDVMDVTTTLLEEMTMSNLQPDPLRQTTEELTLKVACEGAIVKKNENEVEVQGAGISQDSEPHNEPESPSTSSNEDINPATAADLEDTIQAHIQQFGEIFPDADPDYLSERANELAGDQEKFVQLVVEMTENRSYPKMEEYLKRQKKMNMRKKFIEGMSVEEFMEYFEDPEKVFCDTTKEMSKLYVTNAREQLMNDLPYHLSRRISSVFKLNNFHYMPTLRLLRLEAGERKSKRKNGGSLPGDLDDIFLKELCYVKMEKKIKEYYENKEKDKKLSFQKAKESGELQECQCCFDDEVLITDMSTCDNSAPHLFCNNCIRRYSEEQIGQGRLEFICLEGECKSPFSLNTLKRLLKPSIFSNLLKRKQAEEIAAAGIEDLESCPFCNFATIMPNKEDKVFKCLNPECLKDSCRLCKELNHIPLRCEEVEKKKQVHARTFLENEMTEAMIRECYNCKKRFIKEEGCNKMMCSCGAIMCYLCKKPIKGYDHFSSDGRQSSTSKNKCPLWSNSLKLHAEEVQKRAAEAKEKLDPNVELIHDPTKDMPQVPEYLKNPKPNHVPAARHQPPPQVNIIRVNRLPHWAHRMNLELNPHPAEVLIAERHSHHHRHQHYYLPPFQDPPPPAHLPPPPAHLPPPPAHLPHPPRAHPPPQHHHLPLPRPQPPRVQFVEDANRARVPNHHHHHPVGQAVQQEILHPPPPPPIVELNEHLMRAFLPAPAAPPIPLPAPFGHRPAYLQFAANPPRHPPPIRVEANDRRFTILNDYGNDKKNDNNNNNSGFFP